MIYKLILIPLNKQNKLSHIHLFLGGFAKVCFGYIQVSTHPKRPTRPTTNEQKMKDKMPTHRKIKRAASRHTNQRFCSTFNFTQPHNIHCSFSMTNIS